MSAPASAIVVSELEEASEHQEFLRAGRPVTSLDGNYEWRMITSSDLIRLANGSRSLRAKSLRGGC